MAIKIKDYEPIRVYQGNGYEIGLYKKDDEYKALEKKLLKYINKDWNV